MTGSRRVATSAVRMACVVVACVVALLPAAVSAGYDWPQFAGDAQHSGANTQELTVGPENVRTLRRTWRIDLPTNVDGTPVFLHDVQTPRGVRDLMYVTTTGGYIFALDMYNGEAIWSHLHDPGKCRINAPEGGTGGKGACFTTSSPAIDPNRQFVYTYGLDGYVHRYTVGTGEEAVGSGWPVQVTKKPWDEKGSSALAIATAKNGVSYLYVTLAGYPLDRNTYGDTQGHLVTINLATGTTNVFNVLCSDKPGLLGRNECPATRGGIWARSGVVYDADLDRIFVATGNGPWNPGKHHWADSVLALRPDGTGSGDGNPLDSYTPANQAFLEKEDVDLGSSLLAIVNAPPGYPVRKLGLQPGKDGNLRLLNLSNLSGKGKPGQLGGELDFWPVPQNLGQPTFGGVRTVPVVWNDPADGSVWVFVGNLSGIAGMKLVLDLNKAPVFRTIWQAVGQGSEGAPLVANGVLYWAVNNVLRAFDPRTGQILWQTNDNGDVHWQAPVVVDGVLYVPDHNKHLSAYAPPPTVTKIEVAAGNGEVAVRVTGSGFTPRTTVGMDDRTAAKLVVVGPGLLTFGADADAVRGASIAVRNAVGQTAVAEVGGKGTGPPPARPAQMPLAVRNDAAMNGATNGATGGPVVIPLVPGGGGP